MPPEPDALPGKLHARNDVRLQYAPTAAEVREAMREMQKNARLCADEERGRSPFAARRPYRTLAVTRRRARTVFSALASMFIGIGLAHAQQAPGSPTYTIAFRTLAPGNTDIFLADRTGRDARALIAHPSLDFNASFSPDGQWIVFTSDREGGADLYRVRSDGSQLERLTDDPAFDDQGAISPDGTSVAFVSSRSGQADIWLLDLTTRHVRNLTRHPAGDFRPAWSPDGKWPAFSSDRDPPATSCPNTTAPGSGPFVTPQYTAVFVMRIDGSGLRRVSPPGTVAASPKWSEDGLRLAFHSAAADEVCSGGLMLGRGTSQLVIAELESGKQSPATSGAGLKLFPHWIEKDQLAYVETKGVRFTGRDAQAGADGQFGRPDWSPDRRMMVFHREVDTRADRDREFVLSPTRDARFNLLRVPGHASLSPDGAHLVYLSLNFASTTRNGILIRANLEGSDRRILFEGWTRIFPGRRGRLPGTVFSSESVASFSEPRSVRRA